MVTHLRAEEGTETFLTLHLPRKMLREVELRQVKGLIVVDFCPLVAQRPPLSSQPHSYPEQHLMALNDRQVREQGEQGQGSERKRLQHKGTDQKTESTAW